MQRNSTKKLSSTNYIHSFKNHCLSRKTTTPLTTKLVLQIELATQIKIKQQPDIEIGVTSFMKEHPKRDETFPYKS